MYSVYDCSIFTNNINFTWEQWKIKFDNIPIIS